MASKFEKNKIDFKKKLCVWILCNVFLKWVVFLCRYNQIDKHLCDRVMQRIIFGDHETKSGQLLCFEEAFTY